MVWQTQTKNPLQNYTQGLKSKAQVYREHVLCIVHTRY